MKYTSIIFFSLFMVIGRISFAQHEHDHEQVQEDVISMDHPEESVTEASNSKYEVLLKFIPVETTEDMQMKLYLSHYKSNQPVDSAQIQIANVSFPEQKFEINQLKSGIYVVNTIMPAEKEYDLLVNIAHGDSVEKIQLSHVDFAHHHGEIASDAHDHSHMSFYLIGIVILIVGLFIGLMLGKRLNRRTAITAIFFALIPSVQYNSTLAHEGHDHSPKKKESGKIGGEFGIEKETQFLLEMNTVVVGEIPFNSGSRLYGTVIAAPDKHAEVITPQVSRIKNIFVKPGDRVEKGQTIAVLERIIEAGNELAIQQEKNRLDAEFEAARLDLERKKSISDIASQKELEAANSRFEVAKNNRLLFQSGATQLTINSPISGVVSPFVRASGSTVNGGEVLFTINNLDRVYVEAQAYEKDIQSIEQAMSFSVQCMEDFHSTDQATLISLVQEFNTSNQSQRVLFEVENADGKLKLGEFVNVWALSQGAVSTLALPEESVTEIDGRPVVFIKNAAEKFEIKYVSAGDRNGEQIVIREGIKAGDRVIAQGSYQCKLIYLNQ
jgi:cobalt-zinc-cadmium efflux system membrane fusion protein